MHRLNMQFGRRAMLFILVAAIFAGCAGQRLHDEGMSLLQEGRSEEGLAKLAAASKADPGNLGFRASLTRNRDKIVNRMLAIASSETAQEHYDAAQKIYEDVQRIDPDSGGLAVGLAILAMERRHARIISEAAALFKKGAGEAAEAALKPVLLENSSNGRAIRLQRQIEDQAAKALLIQPILQGKFRKPVTLQFRDANLKMVFEALSRTSGINVLFDKDVRTDLKTSIFVKDVSVEDAIELILMQSQLKKKILSENTVFIYPNTPLKLNDYQDLKIRSFHLTNADAKQMLAMIKTLLKTKDIFIHEQTNSIVMRDTPEAIRLAEKLVADQDVAEPEVMLEVEVLEVGRTRLSEIGIKFPTKLSLTAQGAKPGGLTLDELRNIDTGNIMTSPALSATINLMMQDTNTNLLASPRIRVRNREKAKIMIGNRVPVITNAVTPVSTGTPVVTGNVQYLDVGLKLEVEPDIHLDNDVSIKINLDVSSIVKEVNNPVSGTQAYQIGTRNASTVLRLKDGETQILAGLINDEDRRTADKVPGLGQLPILGRLFSSNGDDINKSEIILSITPHIVGKKFISDAREVEYWSGTESTLRSSSFSMKSLGSVNFSSTVKPEADATTARPLPDNVTPAAEPASAAQVLFWGGPNQAHVGEKISLTLNASAALGAKNIGFQIGYDSSVLKAIDVLEGDAMKRNNGQPSLMKRINHKSGIVFVGLSGSGEAEAGGGNIITLVFEVTGTSPSSQISVSKITSVANAGGSLALAAPEPYAIEVVQ